MHIFGREKEIKKCKEIFEKNDVIFLFGPKKSGITCFAKKLLNDVTGSNYQVIDRVSNFSATEVHIFSGVLIEEKLKGGYSIAYAESITRAIKSFVHSIKVIVILPALSELKKDFTDCIRERYPYCVLLPKISKAECFALIQKEDQLKRIDIIDISFCYSSFACDLVKKMDFYQNMRDLYRYIHGKILIEDLELLTRTQNILLEEEGSLYLIISINEYFKKLLLLKESQESFNEIVLAYQYFCQIYQCFLMRIAKPLQFLVIFKFLNRYISHVV